jgi:hypothetical protein
MNIMVNWKTSLAGVALLAWAALDVWHKGGSITGDDIAAALAGIKTVTGVGLLYTKDGDK